MNDMQHYFGLYVAYGVAGVAWLIIRARAPTLWPADAERRRHFARPWLELLCAVVACIGVVLVGQVYQAGIRLPTRGEFGTIAESVNQALIFSPMIALLVIRRQGLATAWLPRTGIPQRLLVGLILSVAALLSFLLVRGNAGALLESAGRIYHPRHLDKAVQVFFEDMTIAIVMCRLVAAVGRPWLASGVVGALFAAGHIPAMLSGGNAPAEMVTLVFDALLALFFIRIVQRGADIWWLWCVHFTMDMTQFL